jgi:hypothetical protein
LSVYDFTRGENRTGYFGGPFLEPSEQPSRPHEFDTQNAKAEQDHQPSQPWGHKHHHTEERDCKADDRYFQTRCLLHCLPLLAETIHSNSAASRTVRLSKKKRHQPREERLRQF